jgi:hypothetical protein
MNKILLFVIVIIIGSVLSSGMMDAPTPKKLVSDKTFDCTIRAMSRCGEKKRLPCRGNEKL